MDYHLLTRVDENPILGGESDKKLRRMQYERRITLAQSLLRVIFSTLQNDFASATMKINNLFPQTWVNCLTPPTEDPFGNPIQQSSDSPENGEVPIFWSQQINSGIVDDSSFEQQNLDIILRLCAFAVTSIQLDQLNKATSEAPTSDEQSESLRGTLRRIHQSLIRQFTEIKTDMASMNIKYLQSVGNGRILLLPSWIRKVSSFCRNLGTWGSILLSHLDSTILKDSKKKKSKKGSTSGSGKSVSDSEERVLLQELIHEYKQLLSIIETELNQHTDSQLPHTPSVVEFIQGSCQALLQGSDMSEITIKSMEGSMQVLAKQLLSSQELVCTRLRDFMRNRKHFIESS